MKLLLVILFFSFNIPVFAQLTLQAKLQSDNDYFDYEDYEADDKPIGDLVFLKGCSWYCAGGVNDIYASSELSSNSKHNYSANNAHDFNYSTAWIEGKPDYGIGESITYIFDYTNQPEMAKKLGINRLLIANGYKKSQILWEANSRVKMLRMYVNKEHFADIQLVDEFEIQTVSFEPIMFNDGRKEIKFEIREVYPGEKYKDTALSLLMFDGIGDH